MKQKGFTRALISALSLFIGATATAALPQVTAESNGELYAGQISPYAISVTAPPHTIVTLLWEVEAKERLLSRGEYRVQMDERRQVSVELPIETPALNRGHRIAATLTLSADDGTAVRPRIVHSRQLSLYGPEPLAREADAFQRMDIHLYDPIGKTATMFKTAGIPYVRIKSGALQRLPSSSLLVIGAGQELERQHDKGAWLHRLAAKGQRILLLDPVTGSVTFAPAAGELLSPISSIRLDRAGAMPYFHQYSSIAQRGRGLALRQRRGVSSIEVSNDGNARWSWFSLTYGDGDGLLAIAMWPFAEDFARDPALSLALGRLLHQVEVSTRTEK